MFTAIKKKLTELTCPHRPAIPPGASAIVKQTKWDDDRNVVNRRALCVMCGATWEHIPDWATFKPSPGRPKNGTPRTDETRRKENGK